MMFLQIATCIAKIYNTVDGQDPAPPGMVKTL